MEQLNWRRLLLGGIVAGVTANLLRVGVSRFFLWRFFSLAASNAALSLESASRSERTIATLLGGIFAIGIYIMIRPRVAGQFRTAALAGFASWLARWFFPTFLGNLGRPLLHTEPLAVHLSVYLLTTIAATAVGAWCVESVECHRMVALIATIIWRPEFAIVLFFPALLLYKFQLTKPAAQGRFFFFTMIQHDAAIVALMLLLYATGSALASLKENHGAFRKLAAILSRLCMCALVVIAVLYAIDVAAYYFFARRLYVADILASSLEERAVLSLLSSGLRIVSDQAWWQLAAAAGIIALLARAICVLLAGPVRSPVRNRVLVIAALLLLILWSVPVPSYVYPFVDRPLSENFIERNHNFFVRNTFSDLFRNQILASPPPPVSYWSGRARKLNVMLLVVESLSAYQSRYFSGVENWTPNLDGIAERNTSLTNFYANGWRTSEGMIALLTGAFPLVPELRASRTQAFAPMGGYNLTEYMDVPRPLPRVLSEQGYWTEFVAPGDLTFEGEDKWLPAIGFQKIVDGDDPRYAAQEVRGPFKSVPDGLLYSVALDELAHTPADRPYFMVVQTFWSHPPFLDPNNDGNNGQEAVFRDTDAQIGVFYNRLMKAGFFEHGVLFITGDHRAMEPFHESEIERFGNSAAARIPGVIVTHAINLPQVLPQDFQQRDFRASVESLVAGQYSLDPQEGSFLSNPPQPPRCIIQARGDDRDLVYVKCNEAEGFVRATGDDTRFVSGAVPNEASIIETINRTRARPEPGYIAQK